MTLNAITSQLKSKKLQAVVIYNERIRAITAENPTRYLYLDFVEAIESVDGVPHFTLHAGYAGMPIDWSQDYAIAELPALLKEMGDLRKWVAVNYD